MATGYFALRIIRRNRLNQQRNENKQIDSENFNKSLKFTSAKENICRICLKEGSIPIYGAEDRPDISEPVQMFGDIEISQDDDLPKHLCESCNSHLKSAILFRESAKASNKLLVSQIASMKENSKMEFDQNTDQIEYCNNEDFNNHYEEETLQAYNCKLCKLSFKSNNEYLLHKNSKQHKNIRIQCSICYRLLTAHLYKRHLVRHESASHLICEVCGKMYRKDNLMRHLQLHSFELPFQCQICPYRGRYIDSLKIHMRSHTGSKPFSCDKCKLRFLTRSNLNRHLLTHKKERPFRCNECGRGFYTKKDLEVHFKSDHAGIKEFGCRMCGNKYGTRKALMRHELRVHKRDKMAKGRLPLYLQAEYRKNIAES